MSIIQTRNLTKAFPPHVAVDDVTLHVEPATIVGLIGPSGSGKTTTLRMLLGAVKPTSGTISVMGVDPTTFGPKQRLRIGYMPQQSAMYPDLSIRENLNFAASIYGLIRRRSAKISQALDFVELSGHERTRLSDASGGMRRRTALAATLLHDPHLLVLDEPTAGIDPVLRRKFWDRFTQLRSEGKTLLISTQYVGEAERCDAVVFLARGRLVAFSSPRDLARQAFGGDLVDVVVAGAVDEKLLAAITDTPGVLRIAQADPDARQVRVVVDDAKAAVGALMRNLDRLAASPVVSPYLPPFDDVFVRLIDDQPDVAAARPERPVA